MSAPTDVFDWSLPYPSRRQPVMGSAAVATSQPLAAQAGLEMLRRGGTAADAAVATAAAMTVLEPTTNGIGGDGFALIWDGTKVHGLNASGRSPARLTPERFAGAKGMPRRGWDPVNVPGAVSGWTALWRKFGTLPFAQLLEPAIRYADEGYLVAPNTAELWQRAFPRLESFAEWKRVFSIDGRAPRAGERIRFPDHARTLRSIAASEGESFYRGEVAAQIARAAKEDGGLLDADDLATHSADWVEPISVAYGGVRMHQIPPNGQGIVALIALSILASRDLRSLEVDCPDAHHLAIEAIKLGFRVAHREVADPRFMRVAASELLGNANIAELAAMLDPAKAQDFQHGPPNPGGTILLCTADAQGRMVSLIQSNYEGWGSGIVVPGTGIAMHNRGANFTLEEGHPNRVGGGKRPYHTIIPGMVTAEPTPASAASPLAAFGVMGGFMQPQGQLQTFLRMVTHRQNPQAALDAPRWQVMSGMKVTIEPGFEPGLYDELRRRGHDLEIAPTRSVSFGRGQVIWRLRDGYVAASDQRADGQAVVV
ncbi:MAG: gamma-glutamyltransferase family protein [Phycisphaerae bacterium]|nr:gamma-glutamyltransferase family protein [Phycisphaerae bacterium]